MEKKVIPSAEKRWSRLKDVCVFMVNDYTRQASPDPARSESVHVLQGFRT